MAVHDMRNPTSQIEYVLKESLQKLYNLKDEIERLNVKIRDLEKQTSMNKKNKNFQTA